MSKPIPVFKFEELGIKPMPTKAITNEFNRHYGVDVAQIDADPKIRRSSGIKYKEIHVVFSDSQTVTLRVKETGDVFQVLVNKKQVPIKHQEDFKLAIIDIVNVLNAGRAKWQKKLLAAKITPPKGIITPAPRMLEILTKKRDDLKEAIALVREEITTIKDNLKNA